MRISALVPAGLLLAALLLAGPAHAGTTRAFTITTASANPQVAFKAFDGSPPKVFDFDRDGDLEIVAQNDNRYVYVFSSRTGAILAELKPNYPANWGARPINGPEAAVLVQGGVPHLIAANSAAIITDWVYGGKENGKLKFIKLWERRLADCHGNPGMDSKPVFADLDKDGDFEILAQTEEVGVYALTRTGGLFWKRCIGGGNAEPGVGDLDGDGGRDVVWGSDSGTVTAMDGKTGNTKWSKWLGSGLGSGSIVVGPTVARVDGDARDDVVVGLRDSHDCDDYANNHAALAALRGNGELMWRMRNAEGNPLSHTHPIVHDVDGDGMKDILWADWNTQGHKCGNWETTGPANFYRYRADGALKWRVELGTFWNNKDLALADVDDDGTQEVLATGPSGSQEGIWFLDSKTGAKETFVSAWPWKVTRGPVVADLWGDGSMQWVLPVYAYGSGTSGGAIQVYDTGVPYDAAWPHLPYPRL